MENASDDQRKKLVLRFELRKLMLRLQFFFFILFGDVIDLHYFLDLFSVCVGIDLYLKIVVSLILKDKHGMLHFDLHKDFLVKKLILGYLSLLVPLSL